MRQSALAPEGPLEKCFGSRDIPLAAEQKIDSLSLFVDRTVKISPAAVDLDVSFIDAPGAAGSACEAVPDPMGRWIARTRAVLIADMMMLEREAALKPAR
jgi:hypothetical protein